MAKAWRNENAAKINARKAAGSKEPSARVQKDNRIKIASNASNWLLEGLMGHAGYNAVGFGKLGKEYIPPTEGMAQRLSKSIRKAFSFLGA